ncbi:hypothetical protein J132_00168, partial [Termitomyces sp. J132]
VARDLQVLRLLNPVINHKGRVETILDNGSQIVCMALTEALRVGLAWDPSTRLCMESTNKQVNELVGLACNVPFTFAEAFTMYLQVHIFEKPAYTVLLGRPFDTLTKGNIQNLQDGRAGQGLAGRGSRSQVILINLQRVIAAWETKSKCGRCFVRVLLNQLKALGMPRGFPNFVMSSPSVPVVSPADLDEVVVYDSGESSVVVVVDFLEVPKWTKFCPALPKGKGVSSVIVRGKRRASPPSGAGPSKRPRGRELSAGPPESSLYSPVPGVPLERSSSPPALIPSIMEVFLRKQVEALMTLLAVWEGELRRAREDRDMARTDKEAMERERNTSVRVVTERALKVWGLRERLAQMEGQPAGEAEGRGRVPEGDALWVELEAARRREDWLANKAALGHAGILRWVREHWVLLDGASVAFALIQDGLTQGSAVQPPELQQGMVRLERLLAGHRRCNAVAPGSWWEVAANVGEALPGLAEILAVVWAQMEVDLGVGLPGGLGRE